MKSHTREQISCFGPDGLLRRHDYTVDILGGATGLNYASEYRNVDGIIFPTKRWIYAYQGDYQIIPEPLLVKIDMGEITLTLGVPKLSLPGDPADHGYQGRVWVR